MNWQLKLGVSYIRRSILFRMNQSIKKEIGEEMKYPPFNQASELLKT